MFSSTLLSLDSPEWVSLLGAIVPFMARGVNAKIDHYDDRIGRGVVTTIATDAEIAASLDACVYRVLGRNCPVHAAGPLCVCATCERRRTALLAHPVMIERAARERAIAELPEVNGIVRIGALADLRDLLGKGAGL